MSSHNAKVVFKFAAFHTFSTAGRTRGGYIFIFNDGSIGYGKAGFGRLSAGKLHYEVASEQVAKIETTTSPAGKPQTTLKIVDINGRTDIFRATRILSVRTDIVAAQLPSLLSTFFGNRYTKN